MYSNILVVALLCIFGLGGCAMTSKRPSGSLLDMVKQVTGLGEPAAAGKSEPREISISFNGTEDLNALAPKKGLALVVRVYALKDDKSFVQTSRELLEKSPPDDAVAQQGIVNIKEIIVIPGQKLELNEKVEGDVSHIGVAGFFRDAKASRWRLVVPVTAFARGKPLGLRAELNSLCVVPPGKPTAKKEYKEDYYCKS